MNDLTRLANSLMALDDKLVSCMKCGFCQAFCPVFDETGEEGVAREVLEETGLKVQQAVYQFSLPNIYIYSGFPVHTLDMFFRCTVEDTLHFEAMDDAADLFFLPLKDIRTEEFGLGSIRKGVGIFLEDIRKNKSE